MARADVKAIKAGRLIDGTGAPPVENATVLIEGTTIKAVGKNVKVPKEAQVIDAKGKTVMPGMIDSHVHFFGMKADDTDIDDYSRPHEVRLIKAVFDARKRLATGFTTVKDCGGMNGIFFKRAVAEGMLSGVPRILAAGYMLESTLVNHQKYLPIDYADARTSRITGAIGKRVLICDGVDRCIQATRYALSQGCDFVKIISSDDVFFNMDELKAIVRTAGDVGKFVSVHCDTANFAKCAIKAGVKTIDHAVGMDKEAVEMGNKAGAIFVSTLAVMQGIVDYGAGKKREEHGREWAIGKLEEMVKGYKMIRKMGGTLAIGTDIGGECLLEKIETSAVELELLVKYCGLKPMEAIVAATRNGARACFMGDKTGTIEPGKFADIIVVEGDPLKNIRVLQEEDKIKTVMLEGKIEISK